MVLALTQDLPDVTVAVDAHMRCEQNDDVIVYGDVAAEGVPAGLSCEWKSGEATEWKDAAPALLEEHRDVFTRIVMIDLVRARAVTE